MTNLFMRAAVVSLVGAAALASQSLFAQQTPVTATLPTDHEQTSAGYPVTEYGQSVAIQGNMGTSGSARVRHYGRKRRFPPGTAGRAL